MEAQRIERRGSFSRDDTAGRKRGERAAGRTATIGWAAIAGGTLILLFWILYMAGLRPDDPSARAYEGAFPIADAALGLTLVGAGIGLTRGRPFGSFLLVAAAAAAVYLGILDVTFYAGAKAYAPLTPQVAIEILVNAASIGGGTVGLILGWRFWRDR